MGVQFYDKIEYKDLKEPQDGKTWRAIFEPYDHILNDFEFDVIIGASGKQKCLPAFKHNPVRGKLAIGITANFVRHKNKEEDSVSEIQGVAYVYRQDYFDDLERKTKIQLENIVYYKGDTHYFGNFERWTCQLSCVACLSYVREEEQLDQQGSYQERQGGHQSAFGKRQRGQGRWS